MNSAFVLDSTSRRAGGLFESVRRLGQTQAELGENITVHTIADEYTEADEAAWSPLRILAMQRLGPDLFGYAPGLTDCILASRPAIIQAHGIWKFCSLAAIRAANRARCPRIVHTHGMVDAWALRKSRTRKALARWAYENDNLRGAACIRALNEAEARSIRAFGVRKPIAIVPNGIDVQASSPGMTQQASELLPGRRVLLYLGRLDPKKGLVVLLQAWAQLAAASSTTVGVEDWTLAIAGWSQDGHERALRRLSKELELREDRVQFIGPQFGADKARWYRRCDAFVLPSFSEGLPMAVLEAWAYAKPVILTPNCNLPSGVRVGAAISADPEIRSLALALDTMLAMSDGQRQTMGASGARLANDEFSWPRIGKKMCEINLWILGGGAAPDGVLVD